MDVYSLFSAFRPRLSKAQRHCCREERFLQVNELLDQELSPEQERELRAHLKACPSCAYEYQALQAIVQLLRRLPVPEGKNTQERIYACCAASSKSDAPSNLNNSSGGVS
jgi:hypothetical protein